MVLGTYFLNLSLDVDLSLRMCFLVVPMVQLLSSLPIVINGLVLREAGYVILLSSFGISESSALSLSLTASMAILVMGMMGGLLWILSGETSR